jgi:hypothetical protein
MSAKELKLELAHLKVGRFDQMIDTRLHPLIRALYLAGFEVYSADNHDGCVRIDFEDVDDIQDLIDAMDPGGDDSNSLYANMTMMSPNRSDWWEYEMFPMVLDGDGQPRATILCPCVIVPHGDISELQMRLEILGNEAA